MTRIRLGLIDDNASFLNSFADYLIQQPDLEVVFCARTGADALALIQQHSPDLLILDLSMPVKNGAWVLQELQAAHSPVPVLIFSVFTYPRFARAVLRWSNVAGYLTKSEDPNHLPAIIRQIAAGERGFYSPEILAAQASGPLADAAGGEPYPGFSQLS